MSAPFTHDQIVALAPDAAAVKAGRELAAPRRWPLLGRDTELLWGLAQGSGKDPYQVQVLLAEPAFKCTCPSRKFPCKHGLGLLFLAADQHAALTHTARPAWVEEWLASRAEREQRQQQAAERKATAKPPDAAAQKQRQERKAARSDDGATLLTQWLHDLLTRGLADAAVTTAAFWTGIERRMTDAQAPGLANRVRRIGEFAQRGAPQAPRVLDELGRLQLLLLAFARRDQLPPERRDAVTAAVGWTIAKDEVLARPGRTDDWFVAGHQVIEQDRLVTTITWLLGHQSGCWANLVASHPVHQARSDRLPTGATATGELAWYPGPVPQRALFRNPPSTAMGSQRPRSQPFADLLARHAAALAHEPWHTQTPFLATAHPATSGATPMLVDGRGDALPWQPRTDELALVQSISGGHATLLGGTWDGHAMHVLAADDRGDWIDLRSAS